MIFSLPLDLIRHIFSFLTIDEISNFDCSILSHLHRPTFLMALQSFPIPSLEKVSCKSSLLLWLTLRNIHITTLSIREFENDILENLIRQNYNTLTYIHFLFDSHPTNSTLECLGTCSRLNSLSIESGLNITDKGMENFFTRRKDDNAVPLENLLLPNCLSLTSNITKLIAQFCPELEQLSLSGLEFLEDNDVLPLLTSCPAINLLDLSKTSITEQMVSLVLAAYPRMHTFTLYNCQRISTANKMIALRALAWPQIHSPEYEIQLLGARSIRRALSDEYLPPINEVVSMGAVPLLIEFLNRNEAPVLQFEAAWGLTNIASGSTAHTSAVVAAGAVPSLIALLNSSHECILEQAAWALGNIAGDNVAYRDLVLSLGALPLLSSIEVANPSVMRNITWAISNLCRGKPSPPIELVRVCYPTLLKRLLGDDHESKSDACWALSYLTDGDNERIEDVLLAGLLPPIVTILSNSKESLQTPSLRVIGNILSGDEHQTQEVLNQNILEIFTQLLTQPGRLDFKKEICWSISNITAGTNQQLQEIINSQILVTIIQLGSPEHSHSFGIIPSPRYLALQRECAFCIANATHQATPTQLLSLIEIGSLKFLLNLLTITKKDLPPVLEGILNILQKDVTYAKEMNEMTMGLMRRLYLRGRRGGEGPGGRKISQMIREIFQLIPIEDSFGIKLTIEGGEGEGGEGREGGGGNEEEMGYDEGEEEEGDWESVDDEEEGYGLDLWGGQVDEWNEEEDEEWESAEEEEEGGNNEEEED